MHYQRFGEGLRLVEEALDGRNPYARNRLLTPDTSKLPCARAVACKSAACARK